MNGHCVGADPLDAGTERDEKIRQILYMWLRRGVAEHGGADGGGGGHEGILCRRHAGLIEEDVRSCQCGRLELESIGGGDCGAELLEGEKVRVDTTTPDHVATGRGQNHMSTTGQERTGQENRRTNLGAQVGVELVGSDVLGTDDEGIPLAPLGLCPHRLQELDEDLGVANSRHVLERHFMLSEEGRGDNGERGVLLPVGSMVPERR